jgi:hypothetical protein
LGRGGGAQDDRSHYALDEFRMDETEEAFSSGWNSLRRCFVREKRTIDDIEEVHCVTHCGEAPPSE